MADLIVASACGAGQQLQLWRTFDGGWLSLVDGAPAHVNAAFADGVPAGRIFLAVCRSAVD